MKTVTKSLNQVLATVLTIAALMVEQGAWAQSNADTFPVEGVDYTVSYNVGSTSSNGTENNNHFRDCLSGYEYRSGSDDLEYYNDGNNKTISNLTINNSSNSTVGLFGCIEDGTVENLTLSGATITGNDYVGGIAGQSISSTIQNCKVVSSTITATKEALPCIGAIVGFNNGNTLTSNTYHSTLVYAPNIQGSYYKAGGTAFHIGVGYDRIISNPYGDVSGAVLDDTKLFLADGRDNTALIAAYAAPADHTTSGGSVPTLSNIEVTLTGRTLWKDGDWNTLCLLRTERYRSREHHHRPPVLRRR